MAQNPTLCCLLALLKKPSRGEFELPSNLSTSSVLYLVNSNPLLLTLVMNLTKTIVGDNPEPVTEIYIIRYVKYFLEMDLQCLCMGTGDSVPCRQSITEICGAWTRVLRTFPTYVNPSGCHPLSSTTTMFMVDVQPDLQFPDEFLEEMLKILGTPTISGEWKQPPTTSHADAKLAVFGLQGLVRCWDPQPCESLRGIPRLLSPRMK